MSRRISRVDAERKYQRDQRMRRLQKEGKTLPKSLRGSKANYNKNKQNNIIDRMKDRITRNRGRMPEHLIEEDDNEH